MKKIVCLVLSLLMFTGVLSLFGSAAERDNTFIGGENDAVILISDKASDTEKYAADVLKTKLGEITGDDFEIVTSDPGSGKNIIAVGNTPLKSFDLSSLSDGSYILQRINNVLFICGQGKRGSVYGAYGFLEKYCGVKYLSDNVVITPKSDKIKVPYDLYYTYNCYFEYTETDFNSGESEEFSVANGLSGGANRKISAEKGGTVSYLGEAENTLGNYFCSADKYFDSDPELFAMYNGKRVKDQLCLSNIMTYGIVLNEVLDLVREGYDKNAGMQIISLTRTDNNHYCQCDNCKKMNKEYGSNSGTLINFANSISEAVKESGYNNVYIRVVAQGYTKKAIKNYITADNVIVTFRDSEHCFSHTVDDVDCEKNKEYLKNIKDWCKICKHLYVEDYSANFSNTIGVFPDFAVLQRNMQVYYESGVRGVYIRGNYYLKDCDTEFGALKRYIVAKLMQNPYCDFDDEMNSFLKDYYGGGWKSIRKYIDAVCEASADHRHLSINTSMPQTMILSDKKVEELNSYWDDAKKQAKGDSDKLDRIKRSEISWRFFKACTNSGEFRNPVLKIVNKSKLFNDIKNSGATMYGENEPLAEKSLIRPFESADEWNESSQSGVENIKIPLEILIFSIFLSLIFSVIIFVFAVKKKKYIYMTALPLVFLFAVLCVLNRQYFLDSSGAVKYLITDVISAFYFAFMSYLVSDAARKINEPKKPVFDYVFSLMIGIILFLAPYAAILIINSSSENNADSEAAVLMALAIESVIMLVLHVIVSVRISSGGQKKTDEKDRKKEES